MVVDSTSSTRRLSRAASSRPVNLTDNGGAHVQGAVLVDDHVNVDDQVKVDGSALRCYSASSLSMMRSSSAKSNGLSRYASAP